MKEEICPFKEICGAWVMRILAGEKDYPERYCNDNDGERWRDCPHFEIRSNCGQEKKVE